MLTFHEFLAKKAKVYPDLFRIQPFVGLAQPIPSKPTQRTPKPRHRLGGDLWGKQIAPSLNGQQANSHSFEFTQFHNLLQFVLNVSWRRTKPFGADSQYRQLDTASVLIGVIVVGAYYCHVTLLASRPNRELFTRMGSFVNKDSYRISSSTFNIGYAFRRSDGQVAFVSLTCGINSFHHCLNQRSAKHLNQYHH